MTVDSREAPPRHCASAPPHQTGRGGHRPGTVDRRHLSALDLAQDLRFPLKYITTNAMAARSAVMPIAYTQALPIRTSRTTATTDTTARIARSRVLNIFMGVSLASGGGQAVGLEAPPLSRSSTSESPRVSMKPGAIQRHSTHDRRQNQKTKPYGQRNGTSTNGYTTHSNNTLDIGEPGLRPRERKNRALPSLDEVGGAPAYVLYDVRSAVAPVLR